MIRVIDDLLVNSGCDGVSAAVGPRDLPDPAEVEQLLEAWLTESGRRIECTLLMGRLRRFLDRLVAGTGLSEKEARQARQFIELIGLTARDDVPARWRG